MRLSQRQRRAGERLALDDVRPASLTSARARRAREEAQVRAVEQPVVLARAAAAERAPARGPVRDVRQRHDDAPSRERSRGPAQHGVRVAQVLEHVAEERRRRTGRRDACARRAGSSTSPTMTSAHGVARRAPPPASASTPTTVQPRSAQRRRRGSPPRSRRRARASRRAPPRASSAVALGQAVRADERAVDRHSPCSVTVSLRGAAVVAQLAQVDALPRAEREPPVGDRQRQRRAEQRRLDVRGHVVGALERVRPVAARLRAPRGRTTCRSRGARRARRSR